jgi:hypothetical protein
MVMDAIALDLSHPVSIARAAVAAGGSTVAGATVADTLPHFADGDGSSHVVSVPCFASACRSPWAVRSSETVTAVVGRHSVHAVVRRQVSSDTASLLVLQLLLSDDVDVLGATVMLPSHGLMVWTVPANSLSVAVTASGLQSAASRGSTLPGSFRRLDVAVDIPAFPMIPPAVSFYGSGDTSSAFNSSEAGGNLLDLKSELDQLEQSAQRLGSHSVVTSSADSLLHVSDSVNKFCTTLKHLRGKVAARARSIAQTADNCLDAAKVGATDLRSLKQEAAAAFRRLDLLRQAADTITLRSSAITRALTLRQQTLSASEVANSAQLSHMAHEVNTLITMSLARLDTEVQRTEERASAMSGWSHLPDASTGGLQRRITLLLEQAAERTSHHLTLMGQLKVGLAEVGSSAGTLLLAEGAHHHHA